ncbi:hypothetical protein [Streptomyces sp. NPDC058664]|uniref:hypothetical protein n=1 Tax=unclassified Streptomyces TaxID=2593676 RepID=UPI0036522F16
MNTVLTRNARRDFLESPGWLILCLLAHGWTALSSATPSWTRISAGFVAFVCLIALVRTLASCTRTGRAPREKRATLDPPA